LPQPGPPGEVRIVDYDDSYITVSWLPKAHPGVVGYYVSVKDETYGGQWYHTTVSPISDTLHTIAVSNAGHEYMVAVSTVDDREYVSPRSLPVRIVPSRPHTPVDLAVTLDSLTPELTWLPYDDTSLVSYIVYRRIWEREFAVYDSTIQPFYRDDHTESGVRYSYRITALGEDGQESPSTTEVTTLPMALDRGMMFFDYNYDHGAILGPYQRRYVERLIHALDPHLPLTHVDNDLTDVCFKEMSRYELIIFDSENRGGKFPRTLVDSIGYYLTHGGRAIFITPNASPDDIPLLRPRLSVYESGTLFHDVLHLDSVLSGAIVLSGGMVQGDLTGCVSQWPDFVDLYMDTAKLAASEIPSLGALPLSGCLFPQDDVDILYRYQSLNPDTVTHGQVNGIMHIDDPPYFVLLNFPLSLMTEPAATRVLRASLEALGYDPLCGEVTEDEKLDVGDALMIIDYLYRGGPSPDDWRGDVNCNGGIEISDALEIINVIFRNGGYLCCCPN
jgi:hypothetical protein